MWYNRCTTSLSRVKGERKSCTTFVVQPGMWLYHVCGTTCCFDRSGSKSTRRRRGFLGYPTSFSPISRWIFVIFDEIFFVVIAFAAPDHIFFAYSGGWLQNFELSWIDVSANWVSEPRGLYHLCGTTWEVVVPHLWYNHSGYTYRFPLKITLV